MKKQTCSGSDSVPPTSERLQHRSLMHKFPKDYESKDSCILFFPEEFTYSITDIKNIRRREGEELELMTCVEVKSGSGKFYKGTLIFTGTRNNCNVKMEQLEAKMSNTSSKKSKAQEDTDHDEGSSSDDESEDLETSCSKDYVTEQMRASKELENIQNQELKKLQTLAARTVKDIPPKASAFDTDDLDAHSEINDTSGDANQGPTWNQWCKKVDFRLDEILSLLRGPSHPGKSGITTPPAKKQKIGKFSPIGDDEQQSASNTQNSVSPKCTLIYQHTDLLSISSGGDIKKYALKVFSVLFTEDEMAYGAIGPMERIRTEGKVLLDEERVALMKSAIAEKFSEQLLNKKWGHIRSACNQKCLDIKNKKKKIAKRKLDDLNQEAGSCNMEL